jgi:FkbM family methyltransferase
VKENEMTPEPKSNQGHHVSEEAAPPSGAPAAFREGPGFAVPVYELREARQAVGDRERGELLSRARMQWQFGDWDSLGKLDLLHIEHHPERAELALLAACAALQTGKEEQGRVFLSTATQWGCDHRLIFRLLVSGVYNTLARYQALLGNEAKERTFFQFAGKGLGGDPKLIGEVRRQKELVALPGLHQHKAAGNLATGTPPAAAEGPDKTPDFSVADAVAKAALDTSDPFKPGIVSYAQNFEDVMLWRALGDIENGFYIDIGAHHPVIDSVSKAFYDKGWRGIHVEPGHACARLLRENRPDEMVIEAALSNEHGCMTFNETPGGGMSTGEIHVAELYKQKGIPFVEIDILTITLADVFALAGDRDIHWLKIDVEGMEKSVLEGWGNAPNRPWIVVVESTVPNTRIETNSAWEKYLTGRSYVASYFDGLNYFYISKEREVLKTFFKLPPNIFDGFTLARSQRVHD